MKTVLVNYNKFASFLFVVFISMLVYASFANAKILLTDKFNSSLISKGWKVKAGKWKISNNSLIQYQDNSPNANLYKKLYQSGNDYYEYKLTFTQGSSAGIHIFASDIYYPERGNSYLIWQDDEDIKVYETTEEGGLGSIIDQNNNFPAVSGKTYTYKIWYSVPKRRLVVVRDNYEVIDTLIPFPYKTGNYISLRTRNSIVKFDYLKIKSFMKFPGKDSFKKLSKAITLNKKANKITETEIILRTDTIKSVEDAKEFINMMVKANLKRVAIALKDDETGKFFVQVPNVPNIKIMEGYEDEQIVRTLISEAKKNNIKVYAWIMTFRDPELVKQRPELVMMRKVGNKIVPNLSWVSPINPQVQDRLFKIWKSVLTRFKWDGVRIDHIRFDEDWEDFSPMMRKIMKERYNIDIMKMKPNTDEWIKWVDFRADIIVNFLKKLTKMMKEIDPNLELAMYALPFSAQYGTYHEWTGTGQDFEKLSKIPDFKIFVMAYWEDFCDNEGAEPVRKWLNDVIGNSHKLAGDRIIPTFSVTDWASAWNKSLSPSEFDMYDSICRQVSLKYGYNFIAYFYYWKWGLSQMKKAGVDK